MPEKLRKYVSLLTPFILILILIPSYSFSSSINLENRVIEHTLKNGLKILMMERHQSPTVAAYIRFKVGAVDEVAGTGTAHMLEHMLFKGCSAYGEIFW